MPSAADDQRPERPLRVALVGVGSAATSAHLPALEELIAGGAAELVGVCDRRASRREAVLAAHPDARGFGENDEMLEAVAPHLLVIATPPSAHLEEMGAALARGLHVLCEKPLGLSLDDVEELRGLARSHPQQVLASVHQYRYAAPWRWLSRAAAGAVRDGEPFNFAVTVERPGTDPLSAGGWRSDPEHEGGILGDHAVHYLALLHELVPGCAVVSCRRDGPGGRETASLGVAVGPSGSARIDVSYAGERRRNVIRFERPRQCLEMTWDGECLTVAHNGAARRHPVCSLSDRAVVNRLYAPMYRELLTGLGDPAWRTGATARTLGVASLLARALALAR